MTNPDKEKLPVVAAIDFGTSNSGFAFAFRSECKDSRVGEITRSTWEGTSGSRANGKAPTTALFDRNMKLHAFGFEAQEQYAKLAENKEYEGWHYFRQFKLKLHDKMQLKRDFEIEDEVGQSFPAHQVFTESIRFLKDKLIKTLETSNPMTQSKGKESDYDQLIKWVITIPAIWNEPAKQFMREAAVEAGIPTHNLSFALEPEAAAVLCKSLPQGSFKDTRHEDVINAFKPGGRYMVIDLGGGTVDIAVHQVAEDGTLTEVIPASGGAWGGMHVNETFFSYINRTFGADHVKQYRETHCSDWLQLQDEFEQKKTKLTHDSDLQQEFRIKVPARLVIESTAKVDVQSYDKLKIFYKKLKELYDSSVSEIIRHVQSIVQIVGKLNLILLVGGFATSDYVFDVMKKEFQNQKIIRPLMAHTAVLDGAVMFGFFPYSVSARVCRYTYGINVNQNFRDGFHLPEYKKTIDGEIKCTNIFKIIVEEGEILYFVEKKEVTTLFSTHKASDRKWMDITFSVYASTDKKPTYTTEECCTYLGEIIAHPPANGWPERVKYRLECYFGRTEFEIKVYNDADDSEFKATYDFLLPKYRSKNAVVKGGEKLCVLV